MRMLSAPARTPLAALLLVVALMASACGGATQEDVESGSAGGDSSSGDADGAAAEAGGSESTSSGGASGELPGDLSLAFLPKQVNNPYFTTAADGAQAAVDEFGGSLEVTGPSDASASSQVSYINTLTQQGSSAIITAANDPNAICPALNQANDAGIPIVTFDSDAPDCRDLFINQATSEGIAEVQLQMVVDQLEGGEGNVAILSATPNATNQNAWIETMRELISSNEEYSGLEIVDVVYGNDDDQDSFQETQALLQTYPDLDAIISPTTVGIAAAARYLSDADADVVLTGLGTPNQLREYVDGGTIDQFALWNPEDLGYLATFAAARLADGQISGEAGETFSAGRLGEYTIEEDGVVVLGPPTVFDSSNIGDFDF